MSSRRDRRGHRPRHGDPRAHAPDPTTSFFESETGHDGEGTGRPDPKVLRVCRQVQQRLALALAELDDPALAGAWIDTVRPEPGGASLRVAVVVDDAARAAIVHRHLEVARGLLRAEIAAAIHRKRTPHLQFDVLPMTVLPGIEEDDDG